MSTLPLTEQERRSRRLARIALWLGVASLVTVVIGQLLWHRTPWTSWMFPIVLIGNASVLLMPQASRNTAAVKVYWVISTGVAILVIGDLLLRSWRR